MTTSRKHAAFSASGLLADWQCNESGWWTADNPPIGVCKERDGKWHSYALRTDTAENSPAFKTMKAAMLDAEARHVSVNDKRSEQSQASLPRRCSLLPGTRYTKDGISVDIDAVKDGEVYVRRWPKGVTTQPFFANCIRMPVAQFVEQVQGATMMRAERIL